jgi:tetratricopeptide (TPR) repeat protein
MGLFDFLRRGRRGPESVSDPEQLWNLLAQATLSGNSAELERLCRSHRALIAQHFPAWQRVPEPLRNDRPALERHMHTLVSVAEVFAGPLGDPSLLQRLMGPAESNPLMQWEEKLQQARHQMTELHYDEAARLLCDLLIDVRGLQGSGVDHYLPITLGHLGECYFQHGDASRAVSHFDQALRLCEQSGDAAGVTVYLGNLYEVYRYLGQPGPAADHAERLAVALEAQGQVREAARYRRQATIVRAGEPLNRIVAVVDEQQYELDELPQIGDGRVQFVFQRNRPNLRPAQVLTERGEQLGSAGSLDEALATFRSAAQADRHDPQPHYEAGLTLLSLQRYTEAVEEYEATEERAPGWFHCRADLGLARQLALGHAGHETFLAVRALEDGNLPPQERARLAEKAIAAGASVALLYLLHGKALAALGRGAEAEAAFRHGLTLADEPDVKTRLLVELGVLIEVPAERNTLLREARDLKGNLVAAAMAHVALRRFEATD